jgi:uncharacterized protein DUF418
LLGSAFRADGIHQLSAPVADLRLDLLRIRAGIIRLGIAAASAMRIGVYAFQVLLSRWWLRRFRFGPVEWLWRTLMYGTVQPMRIGPTQGSKAGARDRISALEHRAIAAARRGPLIRPLRISGWVCRVNLRRRAVRRTDGGDAAASRLRDGVARNHDGDCAESDRTGPHGDPWPCERTPGARPARGGSRLPWRPGCPARAPARAGRIRRPSDDCRSARRRGPDPPRRRRSCCRR